MHAGCHFLISFEEKKPLAGSVLIQVACETASLWPAGRDPPALACMLVLLAASFNTIAGGGERRRIAARRNRHERFFHENPLEDGRGLYLLGPISLGRVP